MGTQSVVVVGGGIAGVSTVAALRAGGFLGEVTLVDPGEFPYDRPPLSKEYLAGHKDRGQIALQPADWYDAHDVRLANFSTVAALRPAEGAVELADGTLLRADRVVLATGGRAARPPIPGSDSARVHVLRTADDADRLRAALGPGTRLLVVGAGLIGAEVASTALALDVEVTLVDPVSPPLAPVVGDEVATWLHDLHDARGITTIACGVDSFEDSPTGITAHLSGGADPIEVDAVVLGVGMAPETGLAEAAGLQTDRGIIVDGGQTTSNPAILAVGDPARTCVQGLLLPRTEHWEAAVHDGARAAATILGATAPAATASWFWSDRHGLHVEAVGHLAGAERLVVRGTVGQPPFSVFAVTGNQVIGAVAVDEPNAVRAARRLIDRAVPVDPDRLADSATDLRQLLRG